MAMCFFADIVNLLFNDGCDLCRDYSTVSSLSTALDRLANMDTFHLLRYPSTCSSMVLVMR